MWNDLLRAFLYGTLEGITEWLPVSSTGHLILLADLLRLPMRDPVFALFEVIVQLGAILAVAVTFPRLWFPFLLPRGERRAVFSLWGKLLFALTPCVALGICCGDFFDSFRTPAVVAAALIFYGVAFLLIEKRNKCRNGAENALSAEEIPWRQAFYIGCFQALSLVPGTSRSGATVLGGLLLGLSRTAAASFSFALAVPTMCGAGALSLFRFFSSGETLTRTDVLLLAVGTVTAFLVSLCALRFLLDFVKKHSFAPFGVYRIALGAAVLLRLIF